MPIWLRNFTFNKLQAYFQKEKDTAESATRKVNKSSTNIAKPNIKPSYTTKASNK